MTLFLLAVVALIAVGSVWAVRRRNRILGKKLAKSWGVVRPVAELEDPDLASELWMALHAADPPPLHLDDQAWSDLDMERVLGTLDRTRTTLGRQVLYARVRSGAAWRDTPHLERRAARFDDDEGYRAAAGLHLARAGQGLGPGLWILSAPEALRAPGWYLLLPIPALLMAGSIVVVPFHPAALIAVALIALVNMFLCAEVSRRTGWALAPLRQLGGLLATATALSRLDRASGKGVPGDRGGLAGADTVGADLRALAGLRRIARWVRPDSSTVGDPVAALWHYLNLFFILDANVFLAVSRRLRSQAHRVVSVATWVGEVDLARSVASLRAEPRAWAVPTRSGERPAGSDEATASGEGVWHPLVDDPVPNDVTLGAGEGLLITGANMTGKSTYLRSVGIAATLARTLNTCPAEAWSGRTGRIRTLMDRRDDLAGGRSYYQVEVDTLVRYLEEARDPHPTLFLLDELLRGTNTVERIAAGEAVLRALLESGSDGRSPNAVLVATHDLELVPLLDGRYVSWHFRETVTPGGLLFEYRRRPGPTTTRTAIALLEAAGAPARVVSQAVDRARSLAPSVSPSDADPPGA